MLGIPRFKPQKSYKVAALAPKHKLTTRRMWSIASHSLGTGSSSLICMTRGVMSITLAAAAWSTPLYFKDWL